MDGDIYDQFGEYIDRKAGGVRVEDQQRLAAREPPPATFRLWQEQEDPPIAIEEMGSDEEVTQRLHAGDIKEEPIVIESGDEGEEERVEPAAVLLGKMEDLLDKVGRYQQKLVGLCEKVKEWRANLPKGFLYDSGPESMSGRPGVATVGSGPRSGILTRPPTPRGRLAQAKANASQEPPRKEPEPGKRKETVEVEDDDEDEEEDDRLRQEEDQRAEQRARKRESREETEPVLRGVPPKKKKYEVRLEEGFDVERVIDRLLEGNNDLMTLEEILASAPRLRNELKGRPSRRLVPNVHLSVIQPKKMEWAEPDTKMDWKCVACGMVDLVVKGSKCITIVDTGVEMNIIREADAIRFGLEVNRSDCGILHGANNKAVFCGTASNVLLEIGRVKARACFFMTPNVDHGVLLGRFAEPIAQIRGKARTRSEVEARMQELRPSPVGPDGRPIRLEIGNAEEFIPAFEQFMHNLGILQDEWAATLPLWTWKVERPLARQIKDMVRDWDGCRDLSPLRPDRHEGGERHSLGEKGRRYLRLRGEGHTLSADWAQWNFISLRKETAPSRGEEAWKEEVPPALPETVASPEGMEGGETKRASLRREVDTLIDSHLAAHALELPDLEEPVPMEPPQEPCEAEREVETEIPEKADRLTEEKVPAGETAEEKRARVGRRWEEIRQQRQKLEEAEALPDPPPPHRSYGLKEIWEKFLARHDKDLTDPSKVEVETSKNADEYLDQRIRSLSKTSFNRYMMLEADLRGKEMREANLGVRLKAVEAEVRELRAMVASQVAIIQDLRRQLRGGMDGAESSRKGEQRQPGRGLPKQPPAAEAQQEAPMGRVILEPEDAKALRKAEKEAFEFRAPTELAMLPMVTAGPTMSPSIEEGLPAASGEPVQGSTEGSMDVLLEAVHTMQEGASLYSPEPRIE
ncbi:hypothetical protein CBR_g36326 [Chara braunii]|uniref:Peptidase A2 domain-containing protein n=1 Tax=Chara braunii TaxID=69332 RepID=A0A388LKN4_CHABU|nr:hypothetical protein CBR_g36326 [Chara braunii]|eukprot:GBG82795.1 hypothetical protein CBR_g36326 [Chara braunii]